MRGGAIPLLVWGTINLILAAIDWIWEGSSHSTSAPVNVGLTVFMLLVIYGSGIFLVVARREAIRKGEPRHEGRPEALPRVSVAAAGVGLSMTLIAYGVVFGRFLAFIGIGVLLLSAGRLGRELISQQRTLSRFRRGSRS